MTNQTEVYNELTVKKTNDDDKNQVELNFKLKLQQNSFMKMKFSGRNGTQFFWHVVLLQAWLHSHSDTTLV